MNIIADYEVLVHYSVIRSDLARRVSGLMWIVALFRLVNRGCSMSQRKRCTVLIMPIYGVVADCSM